LEISTDLIKALREQSGAGIMDCKRALQEADGDLERAQEILREKGVVSASKKASRDTNEGLVDSYIHSGGRVGAIVEINCETDFVAKTNDFKTLAHDVAMQIAAMSPLYVDTSDIPEGEDIEPQEACLLQQPFIRDPTTTVQDRINEEIAKLGENVRVRRFTRFSLGE
jgi:elongation factor Ts